MARRKPFRLKSRSAKKSPTGVAYSVQFASRPGKWSASGQYTEADAIKWADKNRYNPDIKNIFQKLKFKDFATGFFIQDTHGFRKRMDKKNKVYSDAYYSAHEGRLVNYLLPYFSDFVISSITPRIIDDWLIDLESVKPKNSCQIIPRIRFFTV